MNLWHWHPSVALGLGGLLAAYLWVVGPRVHARELGAFLGGVAALAVALLGPVAEWAEHVSLSGHMAQHLLLTLVVPPLWLAGTPARVLRPLVRIPGVEAAGRAVTRPVVALLVPAAVLMVWHRPVFFEAALRHEAVHILEHLTLLGTGLLAWWPLLGPLPEWPRAAPPAQLLYLFVSTVPMMAVAAPITLADELLYPFYAGTAAGWPLTPRADQELAGVLMWVVGPFAYVVAGTVVFFRWARLEEAEPEALVAPRAR
jgi:cytochrome c oxidase assembly factor CtaG